MSLLTWPMGSNTRHGLEKSYFTMLLLSRLSARQNQVGDTRKVSK